MSKNKADRAAVGGDDRLIFVGFRWFDFLGNRQKVKELTLCYPIFAACYPKSLQFVPPFRLPRTFPECFQKTIGLFKFRRGAGGGQFSPGG